MLYLGCTQNAFNMSFSGKLARFIVVRIIFSWLSIVTPNTSINTFIKNIPDLNYSYFCKWTSQLRFIFPAFRASSKIAVTKPNCRSVNFYNLKNFGSWSRGIPANTGPSPCWSTWWKKVGIHTTGCEPRTYKIAGRRSNHFTSLQLLRNN